MNDSRNALKYSKLYSELKDSITALDNISGVSEMEALFQNEKVKRENALLQKNMEISDAQKRYSIIIAFLFLGFSSVVYWRYRTEKTARQAQEQLRRSEEIYQRFFENTFLGIFHCNPDGGFMKVNPAMAKLLGYDSPAHFIASVPAFYSLDTINKEKFAEIINRVSQGGGWYFSEEKLIRKDGAVITVKLNFRKETAPDGKIAYIETIFEDITERKLAEEERETYSQKLAALNASKDRFFSIISHDLRGPFHGFLGMTKILADEGEFFPKEKLKKTGEELFKSAQSQYRLLNNLLDWSRIQREDFRLNLQALNLKDEIKTVIEQMELTAGQKGVSLSSGIEEALMVSADYDLLHLLMRNMVSNAVKFSANGGRVIISGQKEQGFVKIAVIDNGVGIANENLEKLFRIDIRFTTKGTANEPGTGLGLMLCREIAEKHGGSISVESEPGKGSSFFVTLPSGDN
jgi:PAS domain S-box-containing protein